MGGPEGQAMLNGFIPNGLLPNEATSVNRVLDPKRWSRVEERTIELITHIQPNESSEGCRNAVASYVQRLIRKCFSCQVFTFGSVPLKTYLPDGDMDLTVFSNNQTLMDSWPDEVCNILESEEGCEDAEFCVKEVHYIQAEVKIIKCIVENIVVDISFNQLGGLCTLCFLEEVDVLISQDHLFKRSIILIKAWCYYESRILGAHHGLISTYALETLVLYIFHIYNNKFSGPLEVLYRFLEFFSKFDWNNYCLSLWGPVPISSLPDMRAEPPRMDCGELLLSKAFLDSCGSVYTAMPSSQERQGQPRQGQPFVSKYFNIIDPLRANNNLGRSVSKGNFFRIKSAFAFGAQQLVQLLDCPEENLIAEFDLFFRNTWDRHGKGHRPDAPNYDICSRYKIVTENSKCHEFKVEGAHTSHAVKTERGNGHSSSSKVDSSKKLSLRSKFSNHSSSSKNGNSKKLSLRSKASNNHSGKVSAKNQQSSWHTSSNWRSDYAHDSEDASNSYNGEFGLGIIEEDGLSVEKAMWIYQEEQDFVNGMTTWGNPNFISSVQEEQDFVNGMTTWGNPNFISYIQAPVIANSTNMSFHVLPPILASGYTHANSFGMLPANVSFESFWGHNMTPNQEDLSEAMGENLVVAELRHEDGNGDEWPELNVNSVRGCGYEDGVIQAQQQRDKKELASVGYSSSYSSSQTSSVNYSSKDYGVTIENRWLTRENYGKDPLDERSIEIDENSTSDSLTTTSEDQILTWDQRQLKKAYPAKAPAVHERQYKGKLVDTISSQPDSQPTVGTDIIESMGSESVASDVQTRQSTRYEPGPMTKSSSNVPATLVFIGPDSAQRMLDEQGLIPVRFYSTGLPVPFLPMLPLHNVPASARTSYAATYPVDSDAELGNYHAGQFNVNLDSARSPKLSDTLNKPNHIGHDAKLECVEKQKFDIFKGNFASHWENLQYGRLCQNLEFQELLPYPPSSIVPLMYLQEQYPWDGYGEAPTNMNLMTHVPHLIPMVPVQSGSDSPTGINRHFAGELPTFRGGTGTYFPSPTSYEKFFRQRKYANYRNDRGNHSHDRRDHHGEKERNRNFYSKPRFSGHKHYRYHQVYRPRIRMDRTDLVVGASEISPSETASPPLASLYPYDPNISYISSNLPEFGSFEPVHVSRTSKALHRGESSHSVVDEQANLEGYSPDSSNYPSSPNF